MGDRQALVFGAHGGLGATIAAGLERAGYAVTRTSRQGGRPGVLAVDPIGAPDTLAVLEDVPVLDAVVWAQGANVNDTAIDVELTAFRSTLDANVSFVVATLGRLVAAERLARGAGLCVLSSIWQEAARPGKFSYTVSKAALGGLVRAASVDLADHDVRINAVLPGVVDTPMTRSVLSDEQIRNVAGQTAFERLVTAEEVAALAIHLCSPAAGGITGQSIPVDLGFLHARRL